MSDQFLEQLLRDLSSILTNLLRECNLQGTSFLLSLKQQQQPLKSMDFYEGPVPHVANKQTFEIFEIFIFLVNQSKKWQIKLHCKDTCFCFNACIFKCLLFVVLCSLTQLIYLKQIVFSGFICRLMKLLNLTK